MQKLIGVVLIVASSTGMGYLKGVNLSKNLMEMQEIRRIFLMLRSEVAYTKSPFGEAFYRIAERTYGKYKEWLFFLAESLNQRSGHTFFELWQHALERYFSDTHLDKKNLELLKNMGTNMGYLDREMQVGAIDLYLEQLKLNIRKMQEELPEKRRILNCLGVMGGIFVAVVLV